MIGASRPWPRGRRLGAGVLAAVCTALAGLAVVAADDGLTYYRTPTEIVADRPLGDIVRVGGLVVPGSVLESSAGSTLMLTDGATDVSVSYPDRLPDVVREGQGAVVEGRFDVGGVLRAERLLMRHSNEYRPPEKPHGLSEHMP